MTKLRRIARVLKARFPNLTTDQTIDLAELILRTLDASDDEFDRMLAPSKEKYV